ncbi:hypothetical protein H5410_001108 [Solanum commersonii]|uniref:F-box domain-containing protein n=1 Tax=Solanum commersonii TaxID=4109 RepID=A0A9J6AZ75_SOLCO|nr:hypothetical protein H5410_001108 [Solanum commersonii]
MTYFHARTSCLCYDVTRNNWRKLKIKGLPKNHNIEGIFSYIHPGGTKFSNNSLHDERCFYTAEQRMMEKSLSLFFKLRILMDSAVIQILGWIALMVYFAFGNPHLLQFSIPILSLKKRSIKLFGLTKHAREGYTKHWVLTLGRDESWREIQTISPYTLYCRQGMKMKFSIPDEIMFEIFSWLPVK